MAKITREIIAALTGATDNQKADLSALFDDIDGKEKEINRLQSERADADKVVEKSRTLEKANKEKDDLISTLNIKLAELTGKTVPKTENTNDDFWGIFEPVRDFLSSPSEETTK